MSETSKNIVLYEITPKESSKPCSPNSLRGRCLLNFKGLKYETQFIPYPDIDKVVTGFGIERNEKPPYQTLPVIHHPEHGYVKDAQVIAKLLDEIYPNTPCTKAYDDVVTEATMAFFKVWVVIVWPVIGSGVENLLEGRDLEYYVRTRTEYFGADLDYLAKNTNWDELWKKANEAAGPLNKIVEQSNGPFFLGSEPTYADITVISYLKFAECCDPKALQQLLEVTPSGRLEQIWNAGKHWVKC